MLTKKKKLQEKKEYSNKKQPFLNVKNVDTVTDQSHPFN